LRSTVPESRLDITGPMNLLEMDLFFVPVKAMV
jgi:hypothetical protein